MFVTSESESKVLSKEDDEDESIMEIEDEPVLKKLKQ